MYIVCMYVYMGICVSIYVPKSYGCVLTYSIYLKLPYRCLGDRYTELLKLLLVWNGWKKTVDFCLLHFVIPYVCLPCSIHVLLLQPENKTKS